ncbi:MAG: hypothetical protein FJW90_06325 [Actinobacteria bacterium]|nr:hypothetical protein [Actinomycetota bacterium]
MGRRALTRGGTAAALALLALYALLGGDLDLGDEGTATQTTTPTVSAPPPAPESGEQGDQPAASQQEPAGDGRVSDEEAAGIAATLALIDSGGPLPYDQDGSTFQNREGRLPQQPEGHYREYTVETPGSDDRGARRLVIGESGETYYTRDHYDSFIEIDPEDFR